MFIELLKPFPFYNIIFETLAYPRRVQVVAAGTM